VEAALQPGTAAFVASVEPSLFIGGEWVAPHADQRFDVLDPSLGVRIAELADADTRDVDAAVAAARRALESPEWAQMPPRQRGRLLLRLAEALDANAQELAELEALDNGKSVVLARNVDIAKAVEWFEYFAGWPTKLEGSTIPVGDGRLVYTLREPIGVVGQIVPWNFPLMLAAWKLAPALAAGCTVVLKPAEETSLTALRLARLVEEVGFPAGVVNVITGTGANTGAALAAHPGIDKLAFTGSTEVGREVARVSGERLRPVTLELGGNSPNIVLGDVDPAAVAAHVASAAFANHGQNCVAGSRLLVPRRAAGELVDAIGALACETRLGPGLDERTEMGPLISERQRRRVVELIEDGRAHGAEVVAGGGVPADQPDGFFLEPTVLVGARDDHRVVREEIFGPVMTILPYDSVDEAVERANATEYGLAAGLWTNDLRAAHDFAKRVKAGSVWINTYSETSPAVPFGGFKASGVGREHGREVVENYLETKSVWVGLEDL